MPEQRDDFDPLATSPRPDEALVSRILEVMRGLRFGSVEIVVHEGRVVQIERREKLRFDR